MKLRTGSDDVILYRPYHTGSQDEKPIANLRFSKVANHHLAKTPSDSSSPGTRHQRTQSLRALANVGGFSAVALTGDSPCFIMKHASSLPQVQNLRGKAVHSLNGFNTDACEHGFVYIDADVSYLINFHRVWMY
jgi:cleavage and polyadenylation specificity factor subunit 1